MKRFAFAALSIIALALLIVAPALAKGTPQRVTLSGPGWAAPIVVADPDQLRKLDPWMGTFLDKGRGAIDRPDVGEGVQVWFYYEEPVNRTLPESEAPTLAGFRPFYRVEYYPDPAGGRGLIYDRGDGITWLDTTRKWFYATAEADALFKSLLAARQPAPPADRVTARPALAAAGVAVGGAALLGLVAWSRRRAVIRP